MPCVSSQGIKILLPPNVSLEKLFTMSPVCFVHHVPGQHRLGLQGGIHNGADLVDVIVGLAPASGGDRPQTVESLLGKPLAPQDDRFAIDGKLLGNGDIGETLARSQHDSAAQRHLLRGAMGADPLLNLLLL